MRAVAKAPHRPSLPVQETTEWARASEGSGGRGPVLASARFVRDAGLTPAPEAQRRTVTRPKAGYRQAPSHMRGPALPTVPTLGRRKAWGSRLLLHSLQSPHPLHHHTNTDEATVNPHGSLVHAGKGAHRPRGAQPGPWVKG